MRKGATVVFNNFLTAYSHSLNISYLRQKPTCEKDILNSFVYHLKRTERVITDMQPSFFQTAECGMKTQKFLQGERRKTILGELYYKVSGREIERTFKPKTDMNSSHIATVIYDKLKDTSGKETFTLLEVGIIRSLIVQKLYELDEHEESFNTKVTVNLYGKEQAAVKLKSSPVRKHKKVKVKEERKFFIPYIDGKNLEKHIQEVFDENISKPLKEVISWEKEKYQIFVELNQNIFTIATSHIYILQDKDILIDIQSKVPLRRIEVEYQGTRCSDPSGNIPANERKKPGEQDTIESEEKVEKEISRQIRKISRRVLEICENEMCLPLVTV
jgi:hypothetical protein